MGINNVFEVEEMLGFGSTPMSFHCIGNRASCFSPLHSNDEVFVGIGAVKKLSRWRWMAESRLCKVINNDIHEFRRRAFAEFLDFISVGSNIQELDQEHLSGY
jgi:hypothetical protein